MEDIATCIIKHKNKYLFLLNGEIKGDFWGNPSGHIEEDEIPLETVKREVFEETSITVEPKYLKEMKVTEDGKIYKKHLFFQEFNKRPNVVLSNEHNGFGWFTIEGAKKLNLLDSVRKSLTYFK
ncbi:MAG: NUDIX domain-containing protein [Candidatus Aenigmarchaeota archaeon]|nr:NUDIX domain-containing protein [Candidatus Aenigmarchaeota archaeon]